MLLPKKTSSIALTNGKKRMQRCVARGREYIEGKHWIAIASCLPRFLIIYDLVTYIYIIDNIEE